jgi:hypothetical protein
VEVEERDGRCERRLRSRELGQRPPVLAGLVAVDEVIAHGDEGRRVEVEEDVPVAVAEEAAVPSPAPDLAHDRVRRAPEASATPGSCA